MRSAWILPALWLVAIFPQGSSAQSGTGAAAQLESLVQRFSDHEKDLRSTRTELWELGKALGDNYIPIVVYKLEVSEVICHCEAQLISFYADIKDSAKPDYVKKTVGALEAAKKRMAYSLKGIEESRALIPYPPALQLIDRAKASLESSLILMDDAVGALHSASR